MKKVIVLIIIIIFSKALLSQDLIIADKLTGKAIKGVHITSKQNGSTTNKNGLIKLNIFSNDDLLNINHIGYIKEISKKSSLKDTLYLTIKSYLLEGVNFSIEKEPLINLGEFKKIERKEVQEIFSNNISDILKTTSGITVQESQSGGGSPNFRGMEASRLLIVVDGLPINNAIYRSGHVQSSSSINPFFVENINTVTGPAAIVFGDGAMGGAITINTIKIKKEKTNTFNQKYESSSNSVTMNYLGQNKINNISYINGLSISSMGNLKMGNKRNHGYENWGLEKHVINDNEQLFTSYDKYDLLQKTKIDISKNTALSLNTQISSTSNINRFDKLNDISNGERKYKYWYYGPQKKITQSLNYIKKDTTILSDELLIQFGWQKIEESRNQQKTNEQLLSNRLEKVNIVDINIDVKKLIRKTKINYGTSLRKQGVESIANKKDEDENIFYNTSRYPDGGSELIDVSFFGQIHYKLNSKIDLYMGERFNINKLTSQFNDTSTFQLPFNNIELNNKGLISSFGVKIKINNSLKLHSSFFNGFRNPNVDDVGKVFSKTSGLVIIPSNTLAPEKTLNFEYGISFKIKEIIKINTQFYHTQIKDAIQRRNASINNLDSIMYEGELMQIQTNQNISSASIKGLNIRADIKFNKKIRSENIINICEGNDFENNPLAHIPPLTIKSNLTYLKENYSLQINWDFNAKKDIEKFDSNGVDNIEEATSEGVPSWNIVGIKFIKKLDKKTTVSAELRNILDNHYKTFGSGLSSSGRNFVVSLTTNF